ncbi:MAG: hypothetical protein RML10_09765 [Geminocystis sp.]|nr:hypothetical protein [Geminocystis sp.]
MESKIKESHRRTKVNEVVAFIDSYASGFFEGIPIVHPTKAKEVLGDSVVYAFTFPIAGYRKVVFDLLREQYGRDLLYYDYRQTYQRWKRVFPVVENEGYWWLSKGFDVDRAI